MSRRPKPTHLKLLEGNPGKRPLNDREPQPNKKIPSCPSWLSPKAKAAWRELAPLLFDMGVLTEADRKPLEMLVDAYAEYRDARQVVEDVGPFYETTTQTGGRMVREHPAVKQASDAWRRVKLMLVEFGLTPAARSKVRLPGEEDDGLWSGFGG